MADCFQQALASLNVLAAGGKPPVVPVVRAEQTHFRTLTEPDCGVLPKFEADFDQDLVIIGKCGTDESLALDSESSGGEI